MLERQSLEKSLVCSQTSVRLIGGLTNENDFSPPAGALVGFGTFCHAANGIRFHVLFLEIYKLAVYELRL